MTLMVPFRHGSYRDLSRLSNRVWVARNERTHMLGISVPYLVVSCIREVRDRV